MSVDFHMERAIGSLEVAQFLSPPAGMEDFGFMARPVEQADLF